ncbi:hypothetical protein LBMAG53_32360 [Planctomycetota bacterium]|nr:hypothetical protein LBMAG53_32360 [Planctomycetota bacterium]
MAKAANPLDTPMMRQYLEAKAARPGCVLLMRMGDFYEAFLEDAQELSRICGLALTSRNKEDPQPIAMAGMPHHSLKTHLPKLLAAGKQVAVMDQLEDPAQAKGLVRRGLTRVVSAGTLIDEDALDAGSANFLVAVTGLAPERGSVGVAALDLSTGRFTVEEAASSQALSLALSRLAPAELLLPEDLRRDERTPARLIELGAGPPLPVQGFPAYAWKPADARRHLCDRLRVAGLEGFGIGGDDDHLASAAAAALRYAESAAAPHAASAPRAEAPAGENPENHAGTSGRSGLGHLRTLVRLRSDRHLVIDATCRANLELLRSARDGTRRGSLLAAIDRTRTAPGARLLADWLGRPLGEVAAIAERQDAIAALSSADALRGEVRQRLAEVYDVERLLARIATGRCHARDLVHLANSLAAARNIGELLVKSLGEASPSSPWTGEQRHDEDPAAIGSLGEASPSSPWTGEQKHPANAGANVRTNLSVESPSSDQDVQPGELGLASPKATSSKPPILLIDAARSCDPAAHLVADIQRTLVDDPPLAISEGGMVRDGVDPALDELRAIGRDSGPWMAAYEARELERAKGETGLDRLKVGFNGIHGYYIEVAKSRSEQVPKHFIRKQTLVNAERYYTPELKEFEDRALTAGDRAKTLELAHLQRLRQAAEDRILELQRCAQALAVIDVCSGLADLARHEGWCRPVVDDSHALVITAGRHPVVEGAIGRSRFVANNTDLDAGEADPSDSRGRLAVITGPNMAGKSTYIRQVAVVALLAHTGSCVPATAARIGLIDRIFTRVGAGDELAHGRSTFMVEMAETAAILNHASRRSLVVLDEVGRGTSTFDGLSLAWAITEHLHDRCRCRALFATHYHELADLAHDRPGIRNLTVAVAEQDDDVAFLHRIEAGVAAKSYGIHVARLAGVPRSVVARAKTVLATLEQLNVTLEEQERPARRAAEQAGPVQLTLFQLAESPTLSRLKTLDLDQLNPRQAQDLLYELQAAAKRE